MIPRVSTGVLKLMRSPTSFPESLRLCQNLGLVDWKYGFQGFEFEDDFPLHDEIDLISAVELQAFIGNGKRNLPFERESS